MMGKGDIHVCRQRWRERETVKVCRSIENEGEKKEKENEKKQKKHR